MSGTAQWRGLVSLLTEAVDHGAGAIEQVHLETAARPFAILERIPGLGLPADRIHRLHDLFVRAGYGSVRAGARLTGAAARLAFDALER